MACKNCSCASSTDVPSAVNAGNTLEYNENNMGATQHPTIYPTNAQENRQSGPSGAPNWGVGAGWDEGRLARIATVGTPERKEAQRWLNAPYAELVARDAAKVKATLTDDARAAFEYQLANLRGKVDLAVTGRDRATARYHEAANIIAALNHRIAMIERDIA